MKRVLLLSAIILAWFIGCVKEVEQPPIEYKYSVEANNEDFSDKGVNETVSLPFTLKTEYNFTKVPMKYKVESNKEGLFKNGVENILPNDVYTLKKPELKLSYTGKEAGEHIIKVHFFNDNTKKATVTKEIKIKYIEHGYIIEQLVGKNSSYQGEDVNFEYRIVPKDESKKEGYTITFKSFDEADNKLEKTKILFEERNIEFNKSYPITNLSKFKILIKPFYAGTKTLKYVIKNKTGQKEGQIAIEVKPNVFDVTGNLDKTPIGYAGELLNFIGTVKKEPLYVKKLKYKTSIVQGTSSGIETNDWKEIVYEGNQIKIPIKILKNGQYQYKISFRDEFGNEIEKILSINSQANYKFKIEVEGGKNPFNQGEEVTYKINLVREEPRLAALYKITFNELVEGDKGEKATVVTVGGNKISGNTYLVQTDNSDPANVKYFTTVKIKSFSVGKKKVIFKVFREAEGRETDNTTGSIDFEVHKSLFAVEQEVLNKNRIVNIGDIITHTAKVRKSNMIGSIKYKVSVMEGDKMGVRDNDIWKETVLENGTVKIPINLLKEGSYNYKVFYKDEFGNEVVGEKENVLYRKNEIFNVSYSLNDSKVKLKKSFDFYLNIDVVGGNHNSSVEYFVKFPFTKVVYLGKNYEKGEEINIKQEDLLKNNMKLKYTVVTSGKDRVFNPIFWRYVFRDNFFDIEVRNSDGILVKKGLEKGKFPTFFEPYAVKQIGLKHGIYIYDHQEPTLIPLNINHYWYYKETLDVSLENYLSVSYDRGINLDDIEYHFYMEPKGSTDKVLVGKASHNEMLSGKRFFETEIGWTYNEYSGYGDNLRYSNSMKVEVFYKGKVVYVINQIDATFEKGNKRNINTFLDASRGSILYENYD